MRCGTHRAPFLGSGLALPLMRSCEINTIVALRTSCASKFRVEKRDYYVDDTRKADLVNNYSGNRVTFSGENEGERGNKAEGPYRASSPQKDFFQNWKYRWNRVVLFFGLVSQHLMKPGPFKHKKTKNLSATIQPRQRGKGDLSSLRSPERRRARRLWFRAADWQYCCQKLECRVPVPREQEAQPVNYHPGGYSGPAPATALPESRSRGAYLPLSWTTPSHLLSARPPPRLHQIFSVPWGPGAPGRWRC